MVSSTRGKLKKPSPQPSILLVFTGEPERNLGSIGILSCHQCASVFALYRCSFDCRSIDRGRFSTIGKGLSVAPGPLWVSRQALLNGLDELARFSNTFANPMAHVNLCPSARRHQTEAVPPRYPGYQILSDQEND